jgi:hypothetical protein
MDAFLHQRVRKKASSSLATVVLRCATKCQSLFWYLSAFEMPERIMSAERLGPGNKWVTSFENHYNEKQAAKFLECPK